MQLRTPCRKFLATPLTGTIRKLGCGFLVAFRSNDGSILHHFRDKLEILVEWCHFHWPSMTPHIYVKVTIFSTSNNSKMVHDIAIVTMGDEQKVVYGLLNGVISHDLWWPLTQISRAQHCLTFNISNNANTVLYVITKDLEAEYIDGA